MTVDNEVIERRHRVEALAQQLYEASDPNGTPWARRTPIVRDPWLVRAEQQIPPVKDP